MLSLFNFCSLSYDVTLILYLIVICGTRHLIGSKEENGAEIIDASDIDELSGQLQIDFMSNLYAELTASSISPQSEAMNQTVVTIKPSVTGSALCTPSKHSFVEAVLLDFRTVIFNTRHHFTTINKVAIYVVDKSNEDKQFVESRINNNASSFIVTVDGTGVSSEKTSNFHMSASVAIGGKSVFLLPNETGAVCIYFPMKQRLSLGIFGVIWGKEEIEKDMEKVEEAVFSAATRRRRDASIYAKNTTKLDLNSGFQIEATGEPSRKIEHPRFLLKERKASKNKVSNKKSNRNNKRRRLLRSKKKSSRNYGEEKRDFLPFGVEPTATTKRRGAAVGLDGKRRRSLKNGRRRKRRQNQHHHQHSVKIATAEANDFLETTTSLFSKLSNTSTLSANSNQLVDDPTISDESCKHYKLPVRLAELGWKRVIIAPEIVDISYCSGFCSAAKTPTKMSNQAMLLQLFKVVRGASLPQSLPDPQCVPIGYSSLTLLFYDENDNIVLKNYPNMIATSCGCR